MLSAIARLNPHVDMKKIVIGLMDRLSSYAAREAEADSPEERKKSEEEATTRLLEKLRISKDTKEEAPKNEAVDGAPSATQPNGTKAEERPEAPNGTSDEANADPIANGDAQPAKSEGKGISSDIKLYEIFYDQVVNLVKTRGLPVQDTMALCVSLINLAL